MKKCLRMKCFLLVMLATASIACADAGRVPQEMLGDMLHFAKDSIERIEEGKLFVKAEKVYFAQGRIYLLGSHPNSFPLPSILSSGSGLYVETGDGFNIFNVWKCPNCGYWNHNDMNCCQNCHTPR